MTGYLAEDSTSGRAGGDNLETPLNGIKGNSGGIPGTPISRPCQGRSRARRLKGSAAKALAVSLVPAVLGQGLWVRRSLGQKRAARVCLRHGSLEKAMGFAAL